MPVAGDNAAAATELGTTPGKSAKRRIRRSTAIAFREFFFKKKAGESKGKARSAERWVTMQVLNILRQCQSIN